MSGTGERRGTGKPDPQSRILALKMLAEAGPKGLSTEELTKAIVELGYTPDSAASRLYKDKGAGIIFGRGAYVNGRHGIVFRYFASAEWRDAYVFEGEITADASAEKRKAYEAQRWANRLAKETPEQREARRERTRLRVLAKKGITNPPPKRRRVELSKMTREEFLAYDRAYRKEKRDAKRAALIEAGAVVRTRPANGTGRRHRKREPLPGAQMVVKDTSVPVPVRVTARPVLTGPVDMSRAKVTVAPVGRDYRYHVDPASVERVFSALPVGRYLEEESV